MTLLQLKYFQILSRTLHYTRAAQQLSISQPSLSYAINELEKELSVELFRKENQRITLTIYGEQFLPYVDRALSLLQEGTYTLEQMHGNAPQIVRLGYFQSISASIIPSLIDGFYRQDTAHKVLFQFTESSSSDILNQIRCGSLDLGFSLHLADWAESVPISRQSLYLVVPSTHPLASHSFVAFEDYAGEPQIMLGGNSSLRVNVDQLFSQHGIIPNIAFEVKECNAALQYVGFGFGVSVLPQVPAMNFSKVVFLPILDQGKEYSRIIYLTFHKTHRLSPAVKTVRDYIIDHFALKD